MFRDHGLNIVTAPVDEQGLDVDALETLVAQHRPKLVYTIPVHQNPAGVTLPQERREKLVRLAQEHGFTILADEVYQLLTFEGTPPPSFAAWADTGQVVSLGSFSKILAPGTRLGWINAREDVLERLAQNGALVSGGGYSPLGAAWSAACWSWGCSPSTSASCAKPFAAARGRWQTRSTNCARWGWIFSGLPADISSG